MTSIFDEQLFPVLREPRSFWERTGLSRRQQRALDVSMGLLLLVFVGGWIYAALDAVQRGEAPRIARQVAAAGMPFADNSAPSATFAMDALVRQLLDWEEVRGASGALQVVFREQGDTLTLPDAIPAEVAVGYVEPGGTMTDTADAPLGSAPDRPGVWNFLLRVQDAIREVPDLSIVTLVPSSRLSGGRIGGYRIGEWPGGSGAYAPPRGFVEVTPENMETYVSEHFQLKDFLTKGQEGIWPKYVVLSPRLLDKLELTIQELERRGHPVENVFVVSGFRTPWYNASGGDPRGRGALSRHMYGDAADIAIDNDDDGCMDDLTDDGRATIADARVIAEAAEQVERDHPNLVGGIGIYRPVSGSHCGMVHIDTRGNRARW